MRAVRGRSRTRVWLALLGMACAGAWVWGQTRVDNRVGASTSQVNNQLYQAGAHTGPSSVKYSQERRSSEPMRSEWRNAYVKSGALPSDIRMGYAAMGPMNPSGPMAYIPPKPSYTERSSRATPPPRGSATFQSSNQSIRYSSPPSSPSATASSRVSNTAASPKVSSSLNSRGPINSAPKNAGPVRYTK